MTSMTVRNLVRIVKYFFFEITFPQFPLMWMNTLYINSYFVLLHAITTYSWLKNDRYNTHFDFNFWKMSFATLFYKRILI